MSENQTKKSPPKRFFVSYVFTIFTAVKPRWNTKEGEAKIQYKDVTL